ncbi:MAG: hypothetical protein LBT56_08565 [Prevotellaceae bacterium]|jgi:hypothetical protein|nr:hypothetical protein [Prevotellaceae bacterium]
MKKTLLIILSLSIITFRLFGQDRKQILQYSNDIVLRQAVVDSIINESFWDRDAEKIKSYVYLYHKEDFSEYSKQKLMQYFNRTLPKYEIEKIKIMCVKQLKRDSVQLEEKAKKQNVSFSEYYEQTLEKKIEKNVKIVSVRAMEYISPIYTRILGWLNYKPSIAVLESILTDSVKNKDYAKYNRDIFILNCKLALARMGNKKYETEILNQYKKMDMDCNNTEYINPINNLFYINTRSCINHVINLTNTNEIYTRPYMYGLIDECSPKKTNLIYFTTVILNYPIIFEYEDINFMNEMIIQNATLFQSDSFFEKQYDTLLKWLNTNINTYNINTERLFLP